MAKTKERFCIAKDGTRAGGQPSWGVFDDEAKKFVEGGFFSKNAAIEAAATWNAEAKGKQNE